MTRTPELDSLRDSIGSELAESFFWSIVDDPDMREAGENRDMSAFDTWETRAWIAETVENSLVVDYTAIADEVRKYASWMIDGYEDTWTDEDMADDPDSAEWMREDNDQELLKHVVENYDWFKEIDGALEDAMARVYDRRG